VQATFPALSIILPVGLSFHTFQAMSYTIEVYRRRQKAVRHAGIYALYVMFYPQLVAGPIERPQNLIHQFMEKHSFDYARVVRGLRLMLWGLFKKMVIADGLAVYVDQVYQDPSSHGGIHLLAASLFFVVQTYCDFSGYSDVAIGAAGVLGIKLMTNFNTPYASRSIAEFWRRWHISLSTWFRDYLYIPMGGSKAGLARWHFNILLTFLVSGLWHGPTWHYVAWGGLNGVYLLASFWTQPFRKHVVEFFGLRKYPTLHGFIQIACTFAMVCVAWIFFRAASIRQAVWIIRQILTSPGPVRGFIIGSRIDFAALLIFVCLMEVVQLWQRRIDVFSQLSVKPVWLRWSVYYAAIFAILLFGHFDKRQFIYFQF
jgi:D-alanyl-lipoteichoic acid acyltransferase DltB (MBOAT superfamily)